MAPLVMTAISLASKFIPELIESKLNSKVAGDVAKVFTDAAVKATGLEPKQALESVANNQDFWLEQRAQVIELIKYEMLDTQHAREHTNDGVTTHISYLVMYLNPVYIVACVIALVFISQSDLDIGLITALSTLIGGVINNLLQERQQVMNYRLGSSIGSKFKDLMRKGA